jgi:hypothetical protein
LNYLQLANIHAGDFVDTHNAVDFIPHGSYKLERGQPRYTPQYDQEIRLDSGTCLCVPSSRGHFQPSQPPSIQYHRHKRRITEHPRKHDICPKPSVVVQFCLSHIWGLWLFNGFGREFLKRRVVQGIEIAVVEGELFLRLAVFVDGGCLELLGFVVTFRAPGDIVRIAEGVDVNDIGVRWG